MDLNKLDKIAKYFLLGIVLICAGILFFMAEIMMWKEDWGITLIVHLIMIPAGYLFFRGKLN